jgi:hypothetical protein
MRASMMIDILACALGPSAFNLITTGSDRLSPINSQYAEANGKKPLIPALL